MTTINNLTIEQMREIVNSIPVWAREQNGKQIEYSPTHHNLHPHAQIKWVWNDGSITAICLIEQNQPEYWIDLNDLRTAIAKHDEFKVGDLVVCLNRGFNEVDKIREFDSDGYFTTVNGYYCNPRVFRHASPSEIKAGHRLEAERHG
ncbi:hypothetical protein [Acinetobacter bereziniae]|uniref:Uncharacterized protein n=1 Tax=Acinetobacter bereziniae NIPH 3 TaxID=1217651 RepID=N8YLH8_ACIBZ|nr:hypothetical protein [Acinetobacter bereziniae]ENV20423.1 hypothetical protein F963_03708 [Acinetobacter bereziniae NIPH 3]